MVITDILIGKDDNYKIKSYVTDSIKLNVVTNAVFLGWAVEQDGGQIILRKKLTDLNEYDEDTSKLLDILFNMSNNLVGK